MSLIIMGAKLLERTRCLLEVSAQDFTGYPTNELYSAVVSNAR